MTSLSRQLESLRTATAHQLGVERKHVSLLFDKKEAQKLDRETVFKIGCTGLAQLKKLDTVFDGEIEFFEEVALNFQRTMITKDEDAALNTRIDTFLIKLSPYLQHFACQQVLEWLIFKYQIYSHNAQSLMTTFLPFHETNIYARILSILEFRFEISRDWAFLEPYAKKEIPIPFSMLVKVALSSSHSLLSRISDHIQKAISMVGESFLENKAPLLFTFFAKLLLSVLELTKNVDDALLSKMVPIIANGLRSPLASFRNASLMVVCQLAGVVTLAPGIVSSITKIIIMKMKESSVQTSLSTLTVVCQQQKINEFSNKAILKLLRREESLNVWASISALSSQTDTLPLLSALWITLINIAHEESLSEEARELAYKGLLLTAQPEDLFKAHAAFYLGKMIEASDSGLDLPSKLKKNIYAVAVRFSDEWAQICEEWEARDQTVLDTFVKSCDLQTAMIVKAKEILEPRKRTRTNSVGKNKIEDLKKELPKKTAVERAAEMAANSEFARRNVFSGDPIKKALAWIKKSDWENVLWAIEEMASRKTYFSDKLQEDVEDFVLDVLQASAQHPVQIPADRLKSALSSANLSEDFVVALLTRHEVTGSSAKKAKTSKHFQSVAKVFEGETRAQYERRLTFVLGMLNISTTVPVSARMFATLFEIIKEIDAASEEKQLFGIQELAVGVLIILINNPGKYKISPTDIQMDTVVETMRNTLSHHVLREALRLLTAAAKLNPSTVTAHVMSVFTFMGSGLLRKDNELTLGIIEHTLEALFVAILADDGKASNQDAVRHRLIGVSRVFAASAMDIPAHRRTRMASAISRAIGTDNVWIVACVLLEGYCSKWQRSGVEGSKKAVDQDSFEDLAIDLCSCMEPVQQLSTVLDLIQFCVRLGGDTSSPAKLSDLDVAVFDRNKYSLPKLRHFRFVIVGIVVKVLSNRSLYEKLSKCTDDSLYEAMRPIGKRLMIASVELDEFSSKEASAAETGADPQAMRYWVALQARAETVSDKLRHLLPGGVAACLISDVLEDPKTAWRMREKALQLANAKLMHDGFFYTESGINESHLNRLAGILNQWISPERSNREKVLLCQSAAFSLKLVAKRISMKSQSEVLTQTIEKCVATVADWQTLDESMVGNVLLLAGELIRTHNMRSTMMSAEPLLKICLDILSDCISNQSSSQKAAEEEQMNKRQRVRQQSLCGRKLGSDTLLICTLTCVQRILDQFAMFVSVHIGEVLIRFARLSGRFCELEGGVPGITPTVNKSNQQQSAAPSNRNNILHRLALIRAALHHLELRVLPAHFATAVSQLASEEKPLCALFSLLGGYFLMKNRSVVVALRMAFLNDVYLKALEHRMKDRKPETFENVNDVERYIFSSLIRMADVLTEVDLRTVVSGLVQWASDVALGSSPSSDRNHRLRLVPVFHFANLFYTAFNSLAMPYFGKLIEMAAMVLRGCNMTNITDASKLLLTGKKDTIEGLETDFLLRQVIDFIANCGRHKEFLTPDRAASVAEALIEELVNTRLAGHEARCVPHLAEAIYRVSDAAPDSFTDILTKILLKTRSNRPKIRFRTLLVVEAVFDRIGDGIAPQLPLVLPFLSELLEDENKNVEEQCDRVVRLLQKKFGENIAEGFA